MSFPGLRHTRQRAWSGRSTGRLLAASCIAGWVTLIAAGPVLALSEIGREELPPPTMTPREDEGAAPVPAPLEPSAPASDDAPDTGPETGPETGGVAHPEVGNGGPLPEIIYNLDRLPEPVRRMHDRIVEAAKSGDIEQLRPFLGLGDDTTLLTFGEPDGDPVDILKGLSGDDEGQEILAILEEVLNAGFVHLEAGTAEDVYVWPYFFGIPLDKLDARQRVELFKVVTAGDVEEMKQVGGAYNFYRAGITPEGRWAFFVAGD